MSTKDRSMKLVGVYNAPAWVTMAGLLCGVVACCLVIQGEPELAVVALIWAGICDLFDGMVARRQFHCRTQTFARVLTISV